MAGNNSNNNPLPPPLPISSEQKDIYGRGQPVFTSKPVEPRSIESHVAREVQGISKPALIGYATGLFVFLFGAVGTMFNDAPDIAGIKKTMAGAYLLAAVVVVEFASIADNTYRSIKK